jgi:hypothetical protein
MSNDYAHPVGQVSKAMIEASVELDNKAETARAAGDNETAARLSGEAEQHMKVANTLDRADQAYGDRNKV